MNSEGFPAKNTSPATEAWPEGAAAEAYAEYEQPLEVQEYVERKKQYTETIGEWDTYIGEGLVDDESPGSAEELERGLAMREQLKQEYIEVSADYPGDWTELLYQRLSDPISKQRFIEERTRSIERMLPGTPTVLDRDGRSFAGHYETQIDDYDTRLDSIFAHTKAGPAKSFNREPQHLGNSDINQTGAVFTDGAKDGIPLTNRQKNIVEAHEKGHGFRDFHSPIDTREIGSVIDFEALEGLTANYRELEKSAQKEGRFRSNYVPKPEEIIERMAQFKNYFGMDASEPFTKAHLDYAREHYTADTGLDNGVHDLLHCVTPRTEQAFLKIINQYPV